MTFTHKITAGTWYVPNSRVESWYQLEGGPTIKWLDTGPNIPFPADPNWVFNTANFSTYMTSLPQSGAGAGDPGITSYMWIDEFIISTQPIAPPGAISPTPTPIPGDLNADGTVNSLDWSIMNSKWFSNDTVADLNKDGIVNSLDFSIMNSNWGRTS
jgi:hypothetical protein